MSAQDRWRRVEELCHAALERDAQARAAFLAEACNGDEELRREVDALLAHAQTADRFLASPVGAVAANVIESDRAMRLTTGTRLGPYEIVSALGAGGMGEVYRARDTKLGRDVALKILPETFTDDAQRLARFQREAQVLAALNHPHIAAIYGLEESADTHFLVLELVDGDTLAHRIAAGPLALDDAVAFARQIAEALEAAHDTGIVHRDLKPSNIGITRDGQVKVLDFGLAKPIESASAARSPGASLSPTFAPTQAGMILGTAAYMAPEQAKGRAADKRSDFWSFGCVLYEMLTGRPPFEGEDISDTLAAVLKSEPDWNALPPTLPPSMRVLVQRCLQKDRKKRIGDASTAFFLLDTETGVSAGVPDTRSERSSRWQWALPLVATTAIAAVVATVVVMRSTQPRPASPVVTKFTLTLPDGQAFTNSGRQVIAVSRDGSQLAYVANGRLWVQAFGDFDVRAIAGTGFSGGQPGNVLNPVFSPDGRSVAYFSGGEIKRIAVTGGAPITICEARNQLGMSWDESGIVFGQVGTGIMRVAPNGGKPELLAAVGKEEWAYGPQMLPRTDYVMFTLASAEGLARWDKARIVVQSLKSAERKLLITGGSDARYVNTGHLLYATAGVEFAVPFDLSRLAVTGTPVPVVNGVRRSLGEAFGATHLSVSLNGTLVYVPGLATTSLAESHVVLFDRTGVVSPLKLPPARYGTPRVSPDGTRVAFTISDDKQSDIWVSDLEGDSAPRRLTFGGRNTEPIWSPDGQMIAFRSDRDGEPVIVRQRSDGTGRTERMTQGTTGRGAGSSPTDPSDPRRLMIGPHPESWSPDGKWLLFSMADAPSRGFSLWMLSLPDGKMTPFDDVRSSPARPNATFSPDGHWIAYAMSESGPLPVIFVQPFPPTGAKYQVTRDVGFAPAWARDGTEIFFTAGNNLSAVVTISLRPSFTVGNPIPVPRAGRIESTPPSPRNIDTTADGRIIGVLLAGDTVGSTNQLRVVVNWTEELKQRVPSR